MRVLFNTTTLHTGGALQGATLVTREALRNPCGIDWRFAMSRAVHEQVRRFHPDPLPWTEVFDETPATSRRARRRLAALESGMRPDCVFTICGPAYVHFAAPHLLGANNPWVAHADVHAYRVLGFPKERLSTFLLSVYRGYWFRRADMLVVQTEYVRQGFHRRIGVPLARIAVVSNTCGQHYLDQPGVRPFPAAGQRVRILCFGAAYRHKRFEIIPQVAKELATRMPRLDFEFVLTIAPEESALAKLMASARALGVESRITNLGPVPIVDGPALYQSCDICFLPTVLECFSATYPESMAMGLPIVTTDVGFLRDVCREAALYFPPDNAAAAAERIVELLGDAALWNRLIESGKEVLRGLPTATEKYQGFVRLLKELDRRAQEERREDSHSGHGSSRELAGRR